MGRDEQEDEWEYEYDANETEHFYVTLDLTSKVPPAQRRRRTSQSYSDHAPGDPASLSNPDSIQILELHSDNPLIAHQGKLYSCQWASAVGTDLLFTLPTESSSPNVPLAPELEDANAKTQPASTTPLRKTADYTILAATPHRLICEPVVRKPKIDSDNGPSLANRPQMLHENTQRMAQVNFLQQLAALKVQKGHTDKVPMHSSNSLDRPRTIIRPLLASSGASSQPSTATDATDRPLPSATPQEETQSQSVQTESMEIDNDVEIELDDDMDEDTPTPGAPTPSTPHSQDQATASTPASPTPTPDRSRRDSTVRRRPGRPAGRTRRSLARDNVIGGLVGDTVANDSPHLLRAFEESTAFSGLQPYEQFWQRKGYRGGRPKGSGKGGARVSGRRRVRAGGDENMDGDENQEGGTNEEAAGISAQARNNEDVAAGEEEREASRDEDVDMSNA